MSRLHGEAQDKLFVHYAFNSGASNLHFLRFMFASKSNASTVRRLLNTMSLNQRQDGYYISLQKSDIYFDQIALTDQTIETVLKFLRPQQYSITINSDFDLERLNALFPYIGGASKLQLEVDDPANISFVHQISGQISELACNIDVLMLADFPLMKLDKLALRSYQLTQDNFSQILHHDVKTLDLTQVSDTILNGIDFDGVTIDQQTVKGLILSISIHSLKENLLSFVKKFHERIPGFQSLELIITAPQNYFNTSGPISKQLIAIYDEIISFKEKTDDFLQDLKIKFIADTFVTEDADHEIEWMDNLKKDEKFKNASFTTDSMTDHENVKLKHRKTVESKVFLLDFDFTFSVISEFELQQAIEDNLDIEDELELDYDYNSDPEDFDDFDNF